MDDTDLDPELFQIKAILRAFAVAAIDEVVVEEDEESILTQLLRSQQQLADKDNDLKIAAGTVSYLIFVVI
jgi:hypothetical protein